MSLDTPEWLYIMPSALFLLWLLNYLAKRRRRVVVPSLLIWRRLLARRGVPRSSSRKFFTLALLFQWLGTAALFTALSSPKMTVKSPSPFRILFVRSAATLAKTSDNNTLFDLMLRRVHKDFPDANITTIPPGPLKPSHLPCPTPPKKGFELLVTDRPRRTQIPQLVVPAGCPNAAITDLIARPNPDGSLQVLVRLLSTGDFAANLKLHGVKEPLVKPLRLSQGEKVLILRIEPLLPVITFHLQVEDALDLDNVSYLCRVGGLERIAVEEGTDDYVLRGFSSLGLQVVVSEFPYTESVAVLNHIPDRLPKKGFFLVFLRNGGVDGVFRVRRGEVREVVARKEGFIFTDALEGLRSDCWIEGEADEVWAEREDGRPVLAVFRRGGLVFVVCALDVRRSGWFRYPSFVEFLWRFCSLVGVPIWRAVRVGERVVVNATEAVSPSGRRLTFGKNSPKAVFFVPDEVGVWRVGDHRIGVSLLNRDESRIEPEWKPIIPQFKRPYGVEEKRFWWLFVVVGMMFWIVAILLERRG